MNDFDEVIPPALNLFTVPPKQCGVRHVQWIDHRPVSPLGAGMPIEFNISGAGSSYIDLARTYLYVKARVITAGNPMPDDDNGVAPVNLWLHSLFAQCDVTLQQSAVFNTGRLYPYKSYIETMLNINNGDRSRLVSEMFYKDTFMEGTSMPRDDDEKTINAGYILRNSRVKGGQWCEMAGVLHHDLCQMDRLLPCGSS